MMAQSKAVIKMMALVIATMMIAMYAIVPSFAAAGDYQITVDNTGNTEMSINGKEYKAYKVFNLTLGGEDTSTDPATYGAYAYSIKNSDWAFATLTNGATTTNGVITTKYGIVLTPSAADPTTYSVNGEGMSDANTRALADALQPVLPGTADGSAKGTSEKAVIDLTEAGWYAVYGTVIPTDPKFDPAEEVVAAVGLTTTDKKVTVNPKASVPTLDKKITGVTEDGEVLDAAGQAAVAKVGAKVSYQLDSITPDLTEYDDYTFVISDTISTGLTYDNESLSSLKVKIAGTELPATTTAAGSAPVTNYTLAVTGQSFTLTIPFATLSKYNAGTAIEVTYDAVVNSGALTTDYENNTASLEYSHSPYDDITNHTPDKKTYVIDLNIDVDKVAEGVSGKKLDGAEFQLYRMNGTTKEYYKWDTTNKKVTWVASGGDTFTTDTAGKLTTQVQGLDKGEYYLEETKAPTGYNTLAEPVKVTISVNEANNKVTYSATTDGATAKVDDGVVDLTTAQTSAQPVAVATIVNNAGSILPSTGGIGTTLFYLIGAILIIGAGVLLVTRRRVDNAE